MHKLLERQLRRAFGSPELAPPELHPFLALVETAYQAADEDRRMADRSLQLMSDELVDRNARLRADMLELRRIEEQLRRGRKDYLELLESVPDVIMVRRGERWSFVNRAAATCLGYASADELRGQSVAETVHPDDLGALARRMAAPAGGADATTPFECRLLRRDRSVRIIEVALVRAVDLDGEPAVLVVGRDITDRKRLEAQLRLADRMASVGTLAAGIAHEINTPVQFVSDSVHFVQNALRDLTGVLERQCRVEELVRAGLPAVDAAEEARQAAEAADLPYLLENVPPALRQAREGLQRVVTIVRAMKEFAHPDEREMAAADLNQAVLSTLTVSRNEYRYVADVETDLGELPQVTCHVGDVNQALLNLVVNAAHAIGDAVKGTDRRGRITVRTRQVEGAVLISIADTGTGIPPEVRDRIFDPFFTTKEVGKGTGQGLAIARAAIVEKHHGEMGFETEVGVGTTFFLRLPIDPRAAATTR